MTVDPLVSIQYSIPVVLETIPRLHLYLRYLEGITRVDLLGYSVSKHQGSEFPSPVFRGFHNKG